jgi:hypothetical protein
VSLYDAVNTMRMNHLQTVMLVLALSVASSPQPFPLRAGQWLFATSRKVAGSISDGVIGIFH